MQHQHNRHAVPASLPSQVYNPDNRKAELLPTIYCWLQGGHIDALIGQWLAEDGTGLGKAVAPTVTLLRVTMTMFPPNEKLELFRSHYPNGYLLMWVESSQVNKLKGLQRAYALNKAKAKAALRD